MTPAAQIHIETGAECRRAERVSPERRLVRRVIESLAPARIEIDTETDDRIELAVERDGWMLARISFGRRALERLAADPAREVKLEYLVRDILRSGARRAKWSYPRPRIAAG